MKTVLSDGVKKIWIIFSEAISSFRKNNDLTSASSLAFSATLALIPALFLLTVLLGFAIGSSHQAMLKTQEMAQELIPRFSQAILKEVAFITSHTRTIGIVNILILLWAITPLVSEMRLALSAIFRTKPGRPYLLEKLLDVAITIVFVVGVCAVAAAGVLITLAERWSGLSVLPGHLGAALSFLFVTAVVFSLYFIFSPRTRAAHMVAGALVTALLWFFMRPAFNLFLTYNPGYGFTFGSFKSLFVVIIWIYYSLAVFLFGAEMAAQLGRTDTIFVRRLMEGKKTVPGAALTKLVVQYEKGSVIFAEGDEGNEMYSVRRGKVSIRKADREIAVIEEGNYFGVISFLLAMPRVATAVVLDDAELIVINNSTIADLMNEYPDFVLDMLRQMASRLRETNRLME